MIGSTVSHYRILDKLGEGGMGVVYKAQDTRLERLVALKFLPTDIAQLEAAKQRFVKEARAASSLNHPNVAMVYDVGETETHSFIAMELVEGETLRSRLRRERLTIEEVQALAIQIAAGTPGRAREGHRPPGHQAGQPAADARRRRQDPRLRHRQARRRLAPHADRHHARHARVHVARAGAGGEHRPPRAISGRSASCCTRCSRARCRSGATARRRSSTRS